MITINEVNFYSPDWQASNGGSIGVSVYGAGLSSDNIKLRITCIATQADDCFDYIDYETDLDLTFFMQNKAAKATLDFDIASDSSASAGFYFHALHHDITINLIVYLDGEPTYCYDHFHLSHR